MDDDDYYPQERVQHAVEKLENSSCLIAGCTDLYMYEFSLQKMYKFYGFHPNHSTNNVMAFKRSYLCNHRHDGGLSMAEEYSFTMLKYIQYRVSTEPPEGRVLKGTAQPRIEVNNRQWFQNEGFSK